MTIYKSKDGVIMEGNRVLDTWDADRLARANNMMYAERLVSAFDGKEFTTDDNGKITEVSEDFI